MSEFKRLSEMVWASPQIDAAIVAEAAQQGFALLINNRPDEEEDDQPAGSLIERAAQEHGLGYVSIPIDHSGFEQPQIEAMADALAKAEGKILAYCRSGTRSTFLWALAESSRGQDPAALARAASEAGYDISLILPTMEMLSEKANG